MGVWAAATPITRSGANPNFVFRVSAVDELVDEALVQYAVKKYAAKRPGMMLINNPLGGIQRKRLDCGHRCRTDRNGRHREVRGQRCVIWCHNSPGSRRPGQTSSLVATVAPGAQMIKSLERMEWTVPVVSHWGISGGRFPELAGKGAQHVEFIQTDSFSAHRAPSVRESWPPYRPSIRTSKDRDVTPRVGVANAYDAMHLGPRHSQSGQQR